MSAPTRELSSERQFSFRSIDVKRKLLATATRAVSYVTTYYQNNSYRVIFALFTVTVSWTCAAIMYAIQHETSEPVPMFQSWFLAISCFSGSGLAIVDVTQWYWSSQMMLMMICELGCVPLCSALPSLLRLWSLRRVDFAAIHPSDALIVKRHNKVNTVIVWTCIAYWFLFQLIAILFVIVACQMPVWWSMFTVASGFTNSGFALDSRSFAIPELIQKPQLLLSMILLIPAGNTLFPVWLRVFVGCCYQITQRITTRSVANPSLEQRKRWFLFNLSLTEFTDGLDELLQCPSLYATHLFSNKSTMRLLGMWIGLTFMDYLMFIPDYNTNAFLTMDYQWLQALFQTATIRTAGFTIMVLDNVPIGHLVYWVVAMYLSSYPFMITEQTVRSETKPVEEADADRDLQEESSDKDLLAATPVDAILSILHPENFSTSSLAATSRAIVEISHEITDKAQVTAAQEIGWLYMAFIIIAYAESGTMSDSSDEASALRMLFEIVSAYGTVGLSLSSVHQPNVAFSATWGTLSQFVLIVLMYFGKFRGLPQTVEIHWVSDLIDAHRVVAANGKIVDVVQSESPVVLSCTPLTAPPTSQCPAVTMVPSSDPVPQDSLGDSFGAEMIHVQTIVDVHPSEQTSKQEASHQ